MLSKNMKKTKKHMKKKVFFFVDEKHTNVYSIRGCSERKLDTVR